MYLMLISIAAAVILKVANNLRRDTGRRRPAHRYRSISDMYPETPPNYYATLYKKPEEVGWEEFCANLLKTINWTEKIIEGIPDLSDIDYSRTLRSVNPLYKGQYPLYYYASDRPHEHAETLEVGFNYAVIVADVMALRNMPDSLDNPDRKGKILVFEIDLTTHDGAAACESNGFVDFSDIPPIDTWFFITTRYLYCWIPTLFIEKMQAAIDVEVYDSYSWLEQSDPALNRSVLDKLENR